MNENYKVESVNFSHQLLLEERFKKLRVNLSEYTFASVYLFRKVHAFELLFSEDLFVKGMTREGETFLMPTSHPSTWTKNTFDFLKKQQLCLFPIPFEWLTFLTSYSKNTLFLDSDSDYVISVEKLAYYPGRVLSKKRNLIKHLAETHILQSYTFDENHIKQALQIVEIWQMQSSFTKNQDDYDSVVDAIHYFNELNLQGRCYYVDGEPAGILMGEKLNEKYYAYHFGKADKKWNGLNQWMFQDFAQTLLGKFEFINFEQDLGLPNLRQTKHSYLPDQLLQKYRIYLA